MYISLYLGKKVKEFDQNVYFKQVFYTISEYERKMNPPMNQQPYTVLENL